MWGMALAACFGACALPTACCSQGVQHIRQRYCREVTGCAWRLQLARFCGVDRPHLLRFTACKVGWHGLGTPTTGGLLRHNRLCGLLKCEVHSCAARPV